MEQGGGVSMAAGMLGRCRVRHETEEEGSLKEEYEIWDSKNPNICSIRAEYVYVCVCVCVCVCTLQRKPMNARKGSGNPQHNT